MAKIYRDQFWSLDPASPPKPGQKLAVRKGVFSDQNGDGQISRAGTDTIDGHKVTHVWVGDTVTVHFPGQGQVTVKGVTIYAQGMKPVFTPIDGTNLQDAIFVASSYVTQSTALDLDDLTPACFTPGARIDTASGPRPVERIGAGDLVVTLDDGLQPVIWAGRCRVAARGRFAPVRIARGALGNDRALLVSPQHRVLVSGWAAELLTGQDAVLVAARHLVDGRRVRVVAGGMVDYLHLGFERHALIRSEGIWTESRFAGKAGRQEGAALFPGRALERLVRPQAREGESRLLAASVLG